MSTALVRPPAVRPPAPPVNPPPPRPAWRRALRGPESDPAWARPALLTLIGATAVLYLWVLGAVGRRRRRLEPGCRLPARHRRPRPRHRRLQWHRPAPTLAQFKALVAKGRIHYYFAGTGGGAGGPGGFGGRGTTDTSAQIGSWVASTFTASTVGGVTLYDLT